MVARKARRLRSCGEEIGGSRSAPMYYTHQKLTHDRLKSFRRLIVVVVTQLELFRERLQMNRV